MSISENGQGSHSGTIQGVPLLDLGRQHAGLREEMLAALGRVYDSGGFVLGSEVTQLEQQLAGAECQISDYRRDPIVELTPGKCQAKREES